MDTLILGTRGIHFLDSSGVFGMKEGNLVIDGESGRDMFSDSGTYFNLCNGISNLECVL